MLEPRQEDEASDAGIGKGGGAKGREEIHYISNGHVGGEIGATSIGFQS
jgi:hypothetical protein